MYDEALSWRSKPLITKVTHVSPNQVYSTTNIYNYTMA